MKIKSLLLGSAAALVAVSGARAADAIIAEPEPVEYVRVCDAYGAGFFYIPGTETCLQISGYVFVEIGGENWNTGADTYSYHYGPRAAAGFVSWVRARVNFDARSDTEWGTLRSYIRVQANSVNTVPSTDPNAVVDQAFIELGGFRIGYTESAWVASQSAGAAQFGSHTWYGGSYGYQQRVLASYTFAGNGFAGTLSLEEDANFNWVPDVVGVASYSAGWGAVWAKLGWDESAAGVGVQAGVQINVPNMPGSSLRVIGYYTSNAAVAYGAFYDAGLGVPLVGVARWSILGSYHHQFNSQFGATLAAQYFNGAAYGFPNGWQVEGEVVYTPVTNFEVRAAVAYARTTGFNGTWSGFLRFTRSF